MLFCFAAVGQNATVGRNAVDSRGAAMDRRAAVGQTYTLFVGTYTNTGSTTEAAPKDSTGSKGIYVYRWDAGTGHATLLSHTEGVVNPSFLAPGPGGKVVYAATDTRTLHAGSVSAFAFDRTTGRLRLIDKVPSGGDNPVYVSVYPRGGWVAVANYTGGSLSVFPIRADGGLEPYRQNIQHTGHGVNPVRQEKAHVHSVAYTPDGRYLYAQDLGLDRIGIYRWDGGKELPLSGGKMGDRTSGDGETRNSAGKMVDSAGDGFVTVTPGAGPRHLDFHPDGRYVYLLEEMGGSVDVYRYHPESGGLDSLQRIATHEPGAKGPFRSADIHVSADGRFLYVSNRESESNITILAIDPGTGMLKTVGYQPVFGKEPRNLLLDPSGKWLLVANQESNAVVIFRIDGKTGLLRPTGEKLEVPAPTCLKMIGGDREGGR